MNRIITAVVKAINENLTGYMPDVKPAMLEENGEVYYMNGKNGTEYDWHVNGHLPAFMVFYNDDSNLGAVKAYIYTDGILVIYLYRDHGKKMVKEQHVDLGVSGDDLLGLAVSLRINADDKRIWNASVTKTDTDTVPDGSQIEEFLANRKFYEPSIRRRDILGKLAVVSKRICEDGCKVGFMACYEPRDGKDSGWFFSAGNESEEYEKNTGNLVLLPVGVVANMDPSIIPFIDSPAGTAFERGEDGKFREYKE